MDGQALFSAWETSQGKASCTRHMIRWWFDIFMKIIIIKIIIIIIINIMITIMYNENDNDNLFAIILDNV